MLIGALFQLVVLLVLAGILGFIGINLFALLIAIFGQVPGA